MKRHTAWKIVIPKPPPEAAANQSSDKTDPPEQPSGDKNCQKEDYKKTIPLPQVKNFGWLAILLIALVFCILTLSALLSALLTYALYHYGVIHTHEPGSAAGMMVLLTAAIFSILFGTLLTPFAMRKPLSMIRQVIGGLNALAEGNYDVRLDFTRPRIVRELSSSFNSLAEELGSTEMLRSDFINNFSHEFKTPITSIRGFARLLKNDELTKEEQNEYLDVIINESGRLAALATNVLNLTKIENQSILSDTGRFNLSEQLRSCILLLEDKWEKKNIELQAIFGSDDSANEDIADLYYTGNQELLNQVWINILDNAIKFSPENGQIIVAAAEHDKTLTVEITDFGCGMSEETVSRIFDKFYQGDTSHAVEGNGVGLAIVRKIVELHGGNIEVSSKPSQGTCMRVNLPLNETEHS